MTTQSSFYYISTMIITVFICITKAFYMRLMTYGSGASVKNKPLAEELSKEVIPWLQTEITRCESELASCSSSSGTTVYQETRMLLVYCYFLLGTCYAEGVGLEKDEKRAYDLYCLSAKEGYPPAEVYNWTSS